MNLIVGTRASGVLGGAAWSDPEHAGGARTVVDCFWFRRFVGFDLRLRSSENFQPTRVSDSTCDLRVGPPAADRPVVASIREQL